MNEITMFKTVVTRVSSEAGDNAHNFPLLSPVLEIMKKRKQRDRQARMVNSRG